MMKEHPICYIAGMITSALVFRCFFGALSYDLTMTIPSYIFIVVIYLIGICLLGLFFSLCYNGLACLFENKKRHGGSSIIKASLFGLIIGAIIFLLNDPFFLS